ncbi:asm-2 Sphingomyelin phosphodiesterase 2 [Candida maltosa Xu316]|uniref:Calcineurin-like phosphoesterase domain-containing protein n=1 Tax=Candida maltosa (strain Xu316) TaxID=1245528 RepID=M3J452_CANMX|nr:hypothetical protein G210_3003 [Candida maltosa Xu316]
MLSSFLFLLISVVSLAYSHTVPGLDSLQIQSKLSKRANLVDPIFNILPDDEIDFINSHLTNLTNFNGSKCDSCKNRIRYGRSLLDEYPDKSHLVSLLLFKYCVVSHNNTESKCDNIDFFVTTDSKNYQDFSGDYSSGVEQVGAVNFYDNDFLQVLKRLNVSNDLDLDYYCYYKGSSACKLPDTPDVEELFGISQWWPEKQPQYYFPPNYTNNSEVFNVLHLTDIHIQLRYEVGTEGNCTSTPCAVPESVNQVLPGKDYNFTDSYKVFAPNVTDIELSFYPDAHYDENNQYVKGDYYDYPKYRGWNFKNSPATPFGGYLADAPEILMNSSLLNMAAVHKEKNFEFAIFTGDVVDHIYDSCTPEYTKAEEVKAFSAMKHFFGNIPVLPALGNHDSFPYGQLAPTQYNTTGNSSYTWNEDEMVDLWINNEWFEEKSREDLKSHYAGFSYVTNRGLKVIGLNSNAYYQKNLWTYIDHTTNPDPFGQWEFLVNELVESEKNGQRVWIMAHIPVTDADTLPINSRIFGKIVERFSPYTIANIFYGHTHQDQFHVLYSSNSSQEAEDIINMSWVLQSITPLSNYNPSWRYYEVENESFNIMNSYNYYTQLNETFVNGGAEPSWRFEYSARDLYDPEGTWPEDAPLNATFWHTYVLTPIKNETNIEFNHLFSQMQYRYGPGVLDCKNGSVVSDDCYNDNYCVVGSFYSDDYQKCLRD